ncbi:unnamed protein product [Echinostoma caproni]|uniref:Cilia- and flagella-associated protein 157 n=1 Tax=Echinostoma caproni TaxID=27848 RepID=A0A183ALG0_9TREM|nr:unnamed protein product [Echinostoma caproni]
MTAEEQKIEELLTAMEPKLAISQNRLSLNAGSDKRDSTKLETEEIPTRNRLAICDTEIVNHSNSSEVFCEPEPPKAKKTSGRKTAGSRKSAADGNRLDTGLSSISVLEQSGEIDGLAALGRDYYLLVIRQLERQITAYRSLLAQLTKEYEALTEEHKKSTDSNKEQLRDLNKGFRDKIDLASDLVNRICGRYAVFEVERSKWQAREQELEQSKRQTEDQMREENESLARELSSLEEFRANRETLLQRYTELVTKWEEMKNDQVEALKSLSVRDAAYRARLKKATQRKLDKVAMEFRQQSYELTEPTFKRMLGESVSIKVQLAKLSTAVTQISEDNIAKTKEYQKLCEELSQLEEEQELVAVRTQLEELIHSRNGYLDAKNALDGDCERLREEIYQLDKSIASRRRRKQRWQNRFSVVREGLEMKTSDVQLMLQCLRQASRSIQALMTNVESTKDESMIEKTTTETIHLILNCFAQAGAASDENSKELITLQTQKSTVSGQGTDTSSRMWTDNDPLSLLVHPPTDEIGSDISEPNSSFEEDFEMEISAPEEEINTASELIQQMSKSGRSEGTQIAEFSLNEGLETQRKQTERLDLLWTQIHKSPLDAYTPSSRSWSEILKFLASNVSFRNFQIPSESRENVYLRIGDLFIVPTPNKHIPTKSQLLAVSRQSQTGSDQAWIASIDEEMARPTTVKRTEKIRKQLETFGPELALLLDSSTKVANVSGEMYKKATVHSVLMLVARKAGC